MLSWSQERTLPLMFICVIQQSLLLMASKKIFSAQLQPLKVGLLGSTRSTIADCSVPEIKQHLRQLFLLMKVDLPPGAGLMPKAARPSFITNCSSPTPMGLKLSRYKDYLKEATGR